MNIIQTKDMMIILFHKEKIYRFVQFFLVSKTTYMYLLNLLNNDKYIATDILRYMYIDLILFKITYYWKKDNWV
jgi:hypothetical protein